MDKWLWTFIWLFRLEFVLWTNATPRSACSQFTNSRKNGQESAGRLVIMVGHQGSWSEHVCCLHLKMDFRLCARGRQWCCIIHYYWWTASIKPRLLFSRAGYASWGFHFHHFNGDKRIWRTSATQSNSWLHNIFNQ